MAQQGYGTGWGATPFGGGVPVNPELTRLPATSEWDIANITGDLLEQPDVLDNVSLVGTVVGVLGGVELCASGPGPVAISVEQSIPSTGATLEVVLNVAVFPLVPPSESEHLTIALNNQQGNCTAVSLYLDGGDVVLAGGHTCRIPLPMLGLPVLEQAEQAYLDTNTRFHLRLVQDPGQGGVFVFCTRSSEVSTGHVLRMVLPCPQNAPAGVVDGALLVARSTSFHACFTVEAIRLSSTLYLPGRAPVAVPGQDRSALLCSIVRLDGTGSFDVEGLPLTYRWRLVEAPLGSRYTVMVEDASVPVSEGAGFSDKLTSPTLSLEHAYDPVLPGDVLVINDQRYDVVAVQNLPFELTLDRAGVQDSVQYVARLLRQRAIKNATTATPSFLPDQLGVYRVDLVVDNGTLQSSLIGELPPSVLLNVRANALPVGITPDMSFMWRYLSDFWRLVDDLEPIETFWSGAAQVLSAYLHRLWQYEYGKSLRTVPRVQQVKWIHYDLLLGEPLPEFTKWTRGAGEIVSAIRSGPYASATTAVIRLTCDAWVEDFELNLDVSGLTVDQARLLIGQALRAHEPACAVVLREAPGGQYLAVVSEKWIRARSDGPFLSGTTSVIGGSGGSREAAGLYRVDRYVPSGGVLVLGDQWYTIEQVRENGYLLVLDRDPPAISQWAVTGTLESSLLNFWDGLVQQDDTVWVEVQPEDPQEAGVALLPSRVLGCSPAKTSTIAVDTGFLYEAQTFGWKIGIAKVLRGHTVPVDPLVISIPTLRVQIEVTDPSAVLRENLDYFLEEVRGRRALRFVRAPVDVFEGAPPNRLWGEYTHVNNEPFIEAAFGIPVGLRVEDLEQSGADIDYLSAVQGLWHCYLGGPVIRNIRAGVQIFLGLPFAERPGVITAIEQDPLATTSRITIQDPDGLAYQRQFPSALQLELNPATGLRYAVGDSVAQFAPLVEGAEVVDWVKDPTWFRSLVKQGLMSEVEKYHTFAVRISSSIYTPESHALVQEFLQGIKPKDAKTQLLVQRDIPGGAEIDVRDTMQMLVRLRMRDAMHTGGLNQYGAARTYDDVRTADGTIRNKFDLDQNPVGADPILWGFDKEWLSPKDSVLIEKQFYHPGGVPRYDGGFQFDVYPPSETEYPGVVSGSTGTSWEFLLSFLVAEELLEIELQHPAALVDVPAELRVQSGVTTLFSGTFTVLAGRVTRAAFHPTGLTVPIGAAIEFRATAGSIVSAAGGLLRVLSRPAGDTAWNFDTSIPAGTYVQRRRIS